MSIRGNTARSFANSANLVPLPKLLGEDRSQEPHYELRGSPESRYHPMTSRPEYGARGQGYVSGRGSITQGYDCCRQAA